MTTEHYPWRPATDEEIREYYREEFPQHVESLPDWITPAAPVEYAVAMTQPYPVVIADDPSKNRNAKRDFIRRSTRPDDQPDHNFEDWDDVIGFFQEPVYNDPKKGEGPPSPGLIDPDSVSPSDYADIDGVDPSSVPAAEAAYYGLENHDRFWVLVFDIDAKDVAVEDYRLDNDSRRRSEIAQEAGVREQPPNPADLTYDYGWDDVEQSLRYGFQLEQWLQNELEFDDTQVFYSGQGAHVYALDEDGYHRYTERTRKFLMSYITEKLDIPVDTKVTPDDSRVMRVPYSLHAGVSRVVTPVSAEEFEMNTFDFRRDPVPEFLKDDAEVTTQ